MNVDNYISRSQFAKWKWRFNRQHTYLLPWQIEGEPLRIINKNGTTLVQLNADKLTIYRHYHFDGATYAPDFKNVLMSAALHDALLQLADKYPQQVTYDMANDAFASEMKVQRFKLRWIYSLGVRLWFSLKPRNK